MSLCLIEHIAMKTYGGVEVLVCDARWKWGVSFASLLSYPQGERAPGTHWVGGWVGPRAGLDAVKGERKNFCSCLESKTDSSAVHPVTKFLYSEDNSVYKLALWNCRGLLWLPVRDGQNHKEHNYPLEVFFNLEDVLIFIESCFCILCTVWKPVSHLQTEYEIHTFLFFHSNLSQFSSFNILWSTLLQPHNRKLWLLRFISRTHTPQQELNSHLFPQPSRSHSPT
jgi:hypothetical protein